MKLAKIVWFVILGIGFMGCKQIAFALYGVSKPKEKKERQIVHKMDKFSFKYDYAFAITDTGFFRYFNSGYSSNQVLLYTSDGKYIAKMDSSHCPSSTMGFLAVFKDSSYVEFLDLDSTNYFNDYFLNLAGTKPEPRLNKKYLAVVYWGTFAGRLNRNSVEWANYLYADPEVDVICVSLDPREFWTTPLTYK